MYYATKWITLEEAKIMYAEAMSFYSEVNPLVIFPPPPINLQTNSAKGPKFNRGKRKTKKW